ncbi:MAG: hypothetical protein KDA68_02965 [Planctomycetaceae bacterium]|nr:hypothetical protein [Planctomycetaceae bacterium]
MKQSRFRIYFFSILWAVIGFSTLLPAVFSFTAFATDASTSHLPTVMFVISCNATPLTCFCSALSAFKLAWTDQVEKAFWVLLVPLIPIAAFVLSIISIGVFQGGGF